MPTRVIVTISLPPAYVAALERVAKAEHRGNVSALVRRLIETDSVTKSALVSSAVAT